MATDTLSDDEMREAVASLTDAELLKLEKMANWLASGRTIPSDDLFQEAICRSLEGIRRCPRGVPLVLFVTNVMRSIVSAHYKAAKIDPIDLAAPGAAVSDNEGEEDLLADVADQAPSPEQLLIDEDAAIKLKVALHRLFENDTDAELVLLDIFAGLTAEETREDLQLDEKQYATIRRRIRRRIDEHYPEGWKS